MMIGAKNSEPIMIAVESVICGDYGMLKILPKTKELIMSQL